MKNLPTLATLSLIGLVGMPAFGQSRSERVDQIAQALSTATQARSDQTRNTQPVQVSPERLMREKMTSVDFDAMPARLALEVWSQQTGVSLVVNWASLELANVDPETPITLKLNRVPAEAVIQLIVGQMQTEVFSEDRLIVDVEPWFVRVMTKRDALRRSDTRVYLIGDLLMTIPHFDGAPDFDLNAALSNTSTGGSNGGGGGGANGGGLFFADNQQPVEREPTKREKAERLMDLIRDSIEPDIWRANGGEYASIRYLNNMLIIRAPDFVHQQIGIPSSGKRSNATTSRTSSNQRAKNQQERGNRQQAPASSSGNVAGVAPRTKSLPR